MRTTLNIFRCHVSSVSNALADVHYVDVNSANPTPPYANWATAEPVIKRIKP